MYSFSPPNQGLIPYGPSLLLGKSQKEIDVRYLSKMARKYELLSKFLKLKLCAGCNLYFSPIACYGAKLLMCTLPLLFFYRHVDFQEPQQRAGTLNKFLKCFQVSYLKP